MMKKHKLIFSNINRIPPQPGKAGRKENCMAVKFTKGYVDTVVGMRTNKSEARRFLHRQLYGLREQITREHYYEMYEYISKATE